MLLLQAEHPEAKMSCSDVLQRVLESCAQPIQGLHQLLLLTVHAVMLDTGLEPVDQVFADKQISAPQLACVLCKAHTQAQCLWCRKPSTPCPAKHCQDAVMSAKWSTGFTSRVLSVRSSTSAWVRVWHALQQQPALADLPP